MKFKHLLLAIALPAVSVSAIATDRDSSEMAYQIQMHNLTDYQWFSPYLCAIHHKRLNIFEFGQSASTGLATFAEDGFNGVIAEELRSNPDVYAVLQTGPGLTPPGASRIEVIEGYAPRNARLTCAVMPVTTNDVLTAVSQVRLPEGGNRTRVYTGTDWDLGSEVNNYSAESMPLDSVSLIAHGPDNAGTIPKSVAFGSSGRPVGVPTSLSPFKRTFIDGSGTVIAESYMSLFHYEGSEAFPAEAYGWSGSASRFEVTRIDVESTTNSGSGPSTDSADTGGITVVGSTISWPDDGWYQVQTEDGSSNICEGGRSCIVNTNGTFIVINHTTGTRSNVVVN